MNLFHKAKERGFLAPLLIFIAALALRLLWLDRVPGAITGDELAYIIPIRAIVLSGHDFFGWNIFQALFFSYPTNFPQAELPFFLLYPAISLFGFSLITTRFTYVVISSLTACSMFLITKKLVNVRTGLIAGILTAISPWQVFIGRTTYEVVPATFFYITAIYFLINEKGKKIFISLPLFILAFYSYIGTKIIFLPIVLVASIFSYLENQKKNAKYYLVFNFICILIVAVFAILAVKETGGRSNEIFTPRAPEIAREVDRLRKQSIAPNFITNIFVNKITIYGKDIAEKTVGSSSPEFLFISGDNFTSLYEHGQLYLIDALLLILGIGFLFRLRKRVVGFTLVLIIISTLPHVLHTAKLEIFAPHLALFMTFLIIPIAIGVSEVSRIGKKPLISIILAIVYVVSAANFLYVYFYQFPVKGNFDFASREVAKYITEASKNSLKIRVYTGSPDDLFKKYIYYNNSLNSQTFGEIKNSITSHIYSIGNITIYPCGDIFKTYDKNAVTIYQKSLCQPFGKVSGGLSISDLRDGGQDYTIYGDNICSDFGLKHYPSGFKLQDFSVESLSKQRFCEAFITK